MTAMQICMGCEPRAAQSERNIVSDKERKMMAMQICTGCEPKGTSISSVKRER
jgi:hypothetical protein